MSNIRKTVVMSGLVGVGLGTMAAPIVRPAPLLPGNGGPLLEYVPAGIRKKPAVRGQGPMRPVQQRPGAPQLGDPLPGLTREQIMAFAEGRAEFENVEDAAGGLGPIFNGVSCVSCHASGGTGGASRINVTRFGREVNGVFEPLEARGGSLLQDKAIAPGALERVPREANIVARRQSTALFGLGLMEAIPDEAIQRNADEQAAASVSNSTNTSGGTPTNTNTTNTNSNGTSGAANNGGPKPAPPGPAGPAGPGRREVADEAAYENAAMQQRAVVDNSDGIRGRVAWVTDVVTGQKRAGRFGWKAQQASVLAFSGDAYLNEMGITNRFFPTENAPNGDLNKLAAFDDVADIEDTPDPSTGLSDIDAAANFMRFLAAPPRLPLKASAQAGQQVFQEIKCATCHKPVMMTGPNKVAALDRKPVWLYSDLLLHNMGSLGDRIVQAAATGSEFRTAPLWGLRASAPYLHDGRAATVDQAIRLHDGEAKKSRDRYLQLSPQQQQQLLEFLGTI